MTGRIRSQERRRAKRTVSDVTVMILYEDRSTWGRVLRGRVTNFSDTGIAIRIRERIEARTYVTFRVERRDWSGSGSIRHCTRTNIDYLIGLEFAGVFNRPR